MDKKKRHVPYHQNRPVVIISVLGFILASFVFLQMKGIPTGYLVYDLNKIEVGEIVKGGSTLSIAPVDGSGLAFNSLEISGQVIGDGGARVFLKNGKEWLLVFSNRDGFTKPGFVIEGKTLREKIIRTSIFGEDNLLRMVIKGVEKPAVVDDDIWEVPSTCWETCRIDAYNQDELKLYFDIDDGTAFFLDRISIS